ncbi:MAG: serine/threonine protein kinase [Planctomycetales bacterium]|nr:serine/threonine protein kinase [Planctomycetales bacterium]
MGPDKNRKNLDPGSRGAPPEAPRENLTEPIPGLPGSPTVTHVSGGPPPSNSDSLGLSVAPPPASAPQRLGAYVISGELGRGGMGVVYRARDPSLGREVALKVLPAGAPADRRARFLREGRVAARLRHPNIVAVHAAGEAEGMAYLVQDLVEGESLAALLDQDTLPPNRAARIVETVARALAHAHALGVIHRDVKPGNILLDQGGEPHLADFGLARDVEGSTTLSRSGQVFGTPNYMSPEQARSEVVDGRADIWSCGVVLYECLTGGVPFDGKTPLAVLAAVVSWDPSPLRRRAPGVPWDLETIVGKCLEKSPERRYATGEALAEDLARFLRGEPVLARRASVARRHIARHPVLWAVVACGGVATAALVSYGRYRAEQHQEVLGELVRARLIVSPREIESGGRSLRSGGYANFDPTITQLQELVLLDPSPARARILLGEVLLWEARARTVRGQDPRGPYLEALQAWTDGMRVGAGSGVRDLHVAGPYWSVPETLDVQDARARVHLALGDVDARRGGAAEAAYDRAIGEYSELIRVAQDRGSPPRPGWYFGRALARNARGDRLGAIADAREGIAVPIRLAIRAGPEERLDGLGSQWTWEERLASWEAAQAGAPWLRRLERARRLVDECAYEVAIGEYESGLQEAEAAGASRDIQCRAVFRDAHFGLARALAGSRPARRGPHGSADTVVEAALDHLERAVALGWQWRLEAAEFVRLEVEPRWQALNRQATWRDRTWEGVREAAQDHTADAERLLEESVQAAESQSIEARWIGTYPLIAAHAALHRLRARAQGPPRTRVAPVDPRPDPGVVLVERALAELTRALDYGWTPGAWLETVTWSDPRSGPSDWWSSAEMAFLNQDPRWEGLVGWRIRWKVRALDAIRLSREGAHVEARAILEGVLALAERESPLALRTVRALRVVAHSALARCYAVAAGGPGGDRPQLVDRAFEQLRRALELCREVRPALAEVPELRSLHGDPRWKALLERSRSAGD